MRVKTVLTLVLFVVLFLPIVFRYLKFEPYPAILLPAGPNKIVNNEVIKFPLIEIYGLDYLGKKRRVDKSFWIYPLPKHYFGAVVKNDFGFANKSNSSDDLIDLNNWYKNKLLQQNLSTSFFYVDQFEVILEKKEFPTKKKMLITSVKYELD